MLAVEASGDVWCKLLFKLNSFIASGLALLYRVAFLGDTYSFQGTIVPSCCERDMSTILESKSARKDSLLSFVTTDVVLDGGRTKVLFFILSNIRPGGAFGTFDFVLTLSCNGTSGVLAGTVGPQFIMYFGCRTMRLDDDVPTLSSSSTALPDSLFICIPDIINIYI